LSEGELNMAMGAAAVVGNFIGSMLVARVGQGNNELSPWQCQFQAAGRLFQEVQRIEDSAQLR
jgi:hypothetical protein